MIQAYTLSTTLGSAKPWPQDQLQNVTYRRYSKSDWDENLKYNNHTNTEGSLMSCSPIQIIFNRIHN